MREEFGTCGASYQEGAPASGAATCACGTFAIGICQECGAPVCGGRSCSSMYGGRRLCSACVTRVATEERDRTEQEALAQRQARRAREIGRLEALGDPIEHLVASVGWLLGKDSSAAWPDHRDETALDFARLNAAVLASGDHLEFDDRRGWSIASRDGRWPWDSAALGRWFAARADWSFAPNAHLRKSSRPTDRAIHLRTQVTHSGQDYSARVSTAHVAVLENGRVVSITPRGPSPYRYALSVYRLPGVDKRWRDEWSEAQLDPGAVLGMAEALDLQVAG